MSHPEKQPVRAVLLDIDGTLLDSNDAHTTAWIGALKSRGHDFAFETIRPYIGKGGDKLLSELLHIGDDSPEGKAINEERRKVFKELLPTLRPTPGARALLERCLAERLRLVVATSASGDELDGLLAQAGVADLIDQAASSSDAQHSKPDPDIVQAALRKAGLSARESVLLGDTPHDIEAASAAGVRTIALRCGGWWDDAALAGAAEIHDDPSALSQRWSASLLSVRD